jgi:hypothetical protein
MLLYDGFLNTKIMYDITIDPNKWVNIDDLELEMKKPYWFKKENGKIVMGMPYSNGYTSGIAEVFISKNGLSARTNTFHILKNSQAQEVSGAII